MIAYDMLGAGASAKPVIDYTPATMVKVLADVMDALHIRRASLVGHSFGGATAAAFAARHPERVDRLVLVDAGYGYALPQVADPALLGHNPGTFHLILPATRADAQALVRLSVADPSAADDPTIVDGVLAGVKASQPMADSLARSFLARRETLDRLLGAVRAPTLIVWGAHDGITPVYLAHRFAIDIVGAEIIVFNEAAHSPNSECAADFNARLEVFLPKR